MNDHQDFHHFLYGRREEVECLHSIVQNVLNGGQKFGANEPECSPNYKSGCSEKSSCCESEVNGEKKCSQDEPESSRQCKMDVKKSSCGRREADVIVPTECNTSNVESTSEKSPCPMVLVCGPAGSGKRTFVRGAFQKLEGALYSDNPRNSSSRQYILASGRFRHCRQSTEDASIEMASDFREEDTRLVAFKEAFQEIHDVLKSDDVMLATIRQKLIRSLDHFDDSDLRLQNELFPCLQTWSRLYLRPSTNAPQQINDKKEKLPSPIIPTPARNTHVTTQQIQLLCGILTSFVRAVSSVIPIIFILEDLQHADAASLMLVETLLAGTEPQLCSKGLLLISTYTVDANVGKGSALTSFLKRYGSSSKDCALLTEEDEMVDLEKTDGPPLNSSCLFDQRICIPEYSWEDVHQWIMECKGNIQKCTKEQKQALTHLVFHSSNGNPVRIKYLLVLLENDEAILHEDINKKRLPNSMSDIYTSIFLQQDKAVQNMLKTAAALAYCGLQDIGCNILDASVNQHCMEHIMIAQRYGLLEYVPAGRYVRFYSQEMKNAVYRQIVCADRSSFHLEVGRRIWRDATLDESKESKANLEVINNLVLATSQFRCIDTTLIEFDEYLYISKSCYEVGKEALFYKDFYNAAKLFEFSMYVLGQNLWRNDLYESSLVLHYAASQAYCYMGEYVCLQRILDAIFDNAITFLDKLHAFVTLCYIQGSYHDLRAAFRTAASTLKELGEPVNQNPNGLTVAWSLLYTKFKLMGKRIDDLVNLPLMENDIDLAVAQLLSFASIYSYIVKPETSIVLGFRLIRLALKKGISGPSAVAFSTYGFVLCAMGNFDEGFQYGEMAMKLADTFEVWRPRISMFFYGYVYQWTHPIRNCIAPLKEASQLGMMNGDLDVYVGAAYYLNETSFFAGTSLCTLEPFARSYCQSTACYKQKNALMSLVPQWSLLKDLTCSEEPLNLSGEITDADSAFKYAVRDDNKYVVGAVYVYRTILSYLNGDYENALEMARKALEQRKLVDFALTFYEGLAALAFASTLKTRQRRKYRNLGQAMAKRLKCWARRCPDNFLNKHLLLSAEVAGLDGNSTSAISQFQMSIDKAAEVGFIHEQGVAFECLGRHHLRYGRTSDAKENFSKARNAFDKWGATQLVQRIDVVLSTI